MNYKMDEKDQTFYGHGKLLISGEYFVLDGALALALPTTVGQSLTVKYRPSYDPFLSWKSYSHDGRLWLEAKFEFWHFNLVQTNPTEEVLLLQKILRQVRKQNAHFLRDGVDVIVETRLEFPLNWGLGASSTLIHNISQWAYCSPFELLFQTFGGSGYDMACAQSMGPILYKKSSNGPKWSLVDFNPPFKDQLIFIHLGKKKSSREATLFYHQNKVNKQEIVPLVSQLTKRFLRANCLKEFEEVIRDHETLIAESLGLQRIKDIHFSDYWGEVKSLGAWGGDFFMATVPGNFGESKRYFVDKGFDVVIPFKELICYPKEDHLPLSPLDHLLKDPLFLEGSEDL